MAEAQSVHCQQHKQVERQQPCTQITLGPAEQVSSSFLCHVRLFKTDYSE